MRLVPWRAGIHGRWDLVLGGDVSLHERLLCDNKSVHDNSVRRLIYPRAVGLLN